MNPETIHRTVAELWNARKIDEIAALAGPDYTYTGRTGMSDLEYRPGWILRGCLPLRFRMQL